MSTNVEQSIYDTLYKAFPAVTLSDSFIRRWCRETAERAVVDLRTAGIGGFIDRNATSAPRVYTDADHEAWVD